MQLSSWTRRSVALPAVLVAVLAVGAVGFRALRDDPDAGSTLTVVGTSDVYDSNLVQDVIKPGFEAAYPAYHLDYVSKGSGAAIEYAEAGTADVLLVHAASLENQFVADGYSTEKFGRAVFWGDYVLLGPKSDPAGVMKAAPHDVVTAFEKIAAAGEAGQAEFVSRGGNPGTTVAEHKIWAQTSGLSTCEVSQDDGGYVSPSTTTGVCAATIAYPAWYHATGLTQGPNIVNADACNYGQGIDCYVLTDRGTFAYLESTGALSNLAIVTRDNAADARGGETLLVNSFHAYAVNPAEVASGSDLDPEGATAFLDWLTSPEAQQAIGGYLFEDGDPPFLPSAAPDIQLDTNPASRISGRLRNVVPGTPPLAGVEVTLTLRGRTFTTTTGPDGSFGFRHFGKPGPFTLDVPQVSQVENADLDPVFGDLLTGTSVHVAS